MHWLFHFEEFPVSNTFYSKCVSDVEPFSSLTHVLATGRANLTPAESLIFQNDWPLKQAGFLGTPTLRSCRI
jgi:hypothetical protein